MMLSLQRFLIFSILFVAFPLHAATPTVDKILSFYQTEAMLGDTTQLVDAALQQRKQETTLSDERKKRILGLVQRIYRKKNLYGVFKAAYEKSISKENMAALFNWMITVKGIRVGQGYATLYASSAHEWQVFFERSNAKIKPNRRNSLETFVSAMEWDQVYITKHSGVDFAVESALNALAPATSRDSIGQLKERVKMRRGGHIDAGKTASFVMALSFGKGLKIEEIDAASKFATGVVGQAASKAYLRALDLTMESAANTLAKELDK